MLFRINTILLLFFFTSSLFAGKGFASDPAYRAGLDKQVLLKRKRMASGPYTTGIGISGSLNPGLTYKQFIREENAFEIMVGTRWRGVSLTALYEACISTGGQGKGFIWSFGAGPRFGFYNGQYYKDYLGTSRNSQNYGMVGLVGIIGFEYFFKTIPFTAGLDYRPFYDLTGKDDSTMDLGATVRFVF